MKPIFKDHMDHLPAFTSNSQQQSAFSFMRCYSTRILTILDNTRSNKIKVVKTPGGKLVAQHVKKQGSKVKCGDCGIALPGVASLRPRQYASISKTHKTVQRAYGGSRCANCVKERIVRAFLIEEQKIVKRVLKEQQDKEKKAGN
ncbi:LSU ribosomal protein L34E [Metschnikowia aff. pulcherrima]|uniref:LSU ribosomal protein L34E n=1 Tax=Metschnikowia aff. pulcherrima TaxID=2163413 RepID=A0A4V1AEU5_9ASCO|nr:LSU ribosomal protein L34E [Metschnikowia aff. pulcherrima]